jgi:AcrR family transcriptional regulator
MTARETASATRRLAILEAARTVFLRHGYMGASMDEVAALAGASKQTVYKHFIDKETLFNELVLTTLRATADSVQAEVLDLRDSGDLAADLRDLARRQLTRVIQPDLLQLRRLVIGEAGRFPELGRAFYELGLGRTITALTDVFRNLTERGLLTVDDAPLAAEHFNWLVVSIPLNRAMFFGDDRPATPAQLRRYADRGVDVFLAAYGTTSR